MNDIYSDIAGESITQTENEVKSCTLLHSYSAALLQDTLYTQVRDKTSKFQFCFLLIQLVDHQVIKTVEVIKNYMKDSISKVRYET